MNRETKRMMQRQGTVEDDDPAAAGLPPASPVTEEPRPKRGTSLPARIAEFFREVRSELRQVAWPTRPEVVSSSTVVLLTLIVLIGLIFLLNWAFSHGVSVLFNP